LPTQKLFTDYLKIPQSDIEEEKMFAVRVESIYILGIFNSAESLEASELTIKYEISSKLMK
jgi:hypothetical protein